MNNTLRTIFLTIFILAAPMTLRAGDKNKICFTGGLEWGYSLTSTMFSHYNFLANTGIRVNKKDNSLNIDSNGQINAYIGTKFLKKFSFTIHGGYYGLQSDRRAPVLSARGSYYFNGYLSDTFILYAEGGKGFATTHLNQHIWLAKLGGAGQLHLSNWMNLIISLSFQYTTDHPASYYDDMGKTSVTSPALLRSDTYYGAVNLAIGLNF